MKIRTRKNHNRDYGKQLDRKEVQVTLSNGEVYRIMERDGTLDINADHGFSVYPEASNSVRIKMAER